MLFKGVVEAEPGAPVSTLVLKKIPCQLPTYAPAAAVIGNGVTDSSLTLLEVLEAAGYNCTILNGPSMVCMLLPHTLSASSHQCASVDLTCVLLSLHSVAQHVTAALRCAVLCSAPSGGGGRLQRLPLHLPHRLQLHCLDGGSRRSLVPGASCSSRSQRLLGLAMGGQWLRCS